MVNFSDDTAMLLSRNDTAFTPLSIQDNNIEFKNWLNSRVKVKEEKFNHTF